MLNELVNKWLDEQLEEPYNGDIQSKWRAFFIQQEYEFKSFPETLFEYLGDEGYTASTLPERFHAWVDDIIYADEEEEEE